MGASNFFRVLALWGLGRQGKGWSWVCCVSATEWLSSILFRLLLCFGDAEAQDAALIPFTKRHQ